MKKISDKFWKNKFQLEIIRCFRNATIQLGDQWDDLYLDLFRRYYYVKNWREKTLSLVCLDYGLGSKRLKIWKKSISASVLSSD